MTLFSLQDRGAPTTKCPSRARVVKPSPAFNVVRLTIRLSLSVVLMLALTSCPLFERLNEMITDKKGSREIGFVVMEPYKYMLDDNKNFTNSIGFDAETSGMEKTLIGGITEAAGSRTWNPFWCQDRDLLKKLYDAIFLINSKNGDVKGYMRDFLGDLRKEGKTKNCEAMIGSVIGSIPQNTSFNKVYAFCYDIAEDKMAFLERPIPRDQGTVKFAEEMGNLITDLCEKLYGKASR